MPTVRQMVGEGLSAALSIRDLPQTHATRLPRDAGKLVGLLCESLHGELIQKYSHIRYIGVNFGIAVGRMSESHYLINVTITLT